MSQTIFISYSWSNTEIVEQIETAFLATEISIKRDIRDLGFKDSIKDFMKQVRDTDYVLIVISENFLKSPNCMFEVLELLKEKEFKKKILPIMIDGVNIHKPEDKLHYIQYWNEKYNDLKEKISNINPTDAIDIFIELKHYENIKGSIGTFLSYLSDTITSKYSELKKENYKTIFDYLGVTNENFIRRILSLNFIKDPIDIEIELDKIENDFPNNAQIFFTKGFYAFKEGMIKKSNYYYEKSIKHDPSFAPSYYNLACNIDNLPEGYERAKGLYEKAIELDPDSARPYVNLGKLYSQRFNNPGRARELYEESLKIDPYSAPAHFNLANLLNDSFNDIRKSRYHFERSLLIEPEDVSVKYFYGLLLWEKFQDYYSAKEQFIEIIDLDLDSNTKLPILRLAELYEIEYKDYIRSKIYYDKFIEIQPNNANDHFLYAKFLTKHIKNKKTLARHHYDKACLMDSSYNTEYFETLLNKMTD